MQTELFYAQHVFKSYNASFGCGFNMKVMGDKAPTFQDYQYDIGARSEGYNYASNMAKRGKLYFTHVFDCKCGGRPFSYGGSFVCNSCGGAGLKQPWWDIKVEKDGNAFCCYGLGFENLQSSDNYAFGDTFQEAIDNYEKLFRIDNQ